MVKTGGAGLSRSGRLRSRPKSDRDEEALATSQRCPNRQRLCAMAVAATATMWSILLFSTWRVLTQEGPKLPDSSIEAHSGVIDSLQSRVMTLENQLAEAKEVLAQKDRQLAALQRDPKQSGEFVPQTQAPRLRGATLPAVPAVAPLESVAVVPSAPAPVAAQQAEGPKGCEFQEDMDYTFVGGRGKEELVKAKSSREECCQLCLRRNQAAPGSCTVSVLSSSFDTPPLACWIKAAPQMGVRIIGVMKPLPKGGVVSCLPEGHGDLPTPPPSVPPSGAIVEHEKSLLSLQQLPAGSAQSARVNAIRDSIRHAWAHYKHFAWGMDELLPISGRGRNRGFHLATTMVDSLDTLWLAGLREEFNEAKDWLAGNLPQKISSVSNPVSVFETNIRVLGGLLSAYDLSKEQTFLTLAEKLGRRILLTVNQRGVTPYTFGGGRGGSGCPSLAESGTLQLEMRYLSRVTGDEVFAAKTMRFYETVQAQKNLEGLWPNCWERGKGKITLGADGDSFYEYLLKVWLQGGNREDEGFLKDMYNNAVKAMQKHMVKKGPDGLSYMGTLSWDSASGSVAYTPEMEHLMCFVPGWLALGAQYSDQRSEVMELADALAYTCWQMYERQPTGISPERVKSHAMDLSKTNTREYILRPEALEGWWYMFEITKDEKFREWGWKTFLAFEKWLWVPNGYASLKDVRSASKNYLDRMESFFIAETQKYLLLLQDPDHTMRLDRYVFNTEAHPLTMLDLIQK